MATTRLTLKAVENCAKETLVRSGARIENAAPLAHAIMEAERDGISSHGLIYLPIYAEHLECGKVDGQATPRVDRPRPGVVAVDAATGFAHPAIKAGEGALLAAARDQGIACMAVRNSYNCGVLGHHAERLAAQGLLALCFTNAPASIAPVSGHKPVIGTNPFALAAPDGSGGVTLVIDQSASVVAKSEVVKYAREGRALPDGWARDASGHPTTDADAALKGTMVPVGGYKGVGMGLMTELFAAALAGANLGIDASPFSGVVGGPPRTGQFFIAIDPVATSGNQFYDLLSRFVQAFTDQDGARLPGNRRFEARKHHMREGVDVDTTLLERITALRNR